MSARGFAVAVTKLVTATDAGVRLILLAALADGDTDTAELARAELMVRARAGTGRAHYTCTEGFALYECERDAGRIR